VFHSFRHGNRDVFTMSDDGADLVRRTTGDDHELDPDWSPDGTAVVFENMTTMGAFGGFEILTLASGERRAVPIVSDFARWAPRGDLIAVHALDGLRVVSPSGGPSRLLVPNTPDEGEAFYAAWSPDGGALYYVAKTTEGSAIRAVPVAGGPSRLLVRFDDPARQHTRYGFSTDGRTFYFTVGSHESDVWVADLVR
jgi:Tol biopolymer transport system component